ncbi:hypothetical protein FUA23_02675 [Neolewinella aurantiaca]|uniref:Uncharacterized protein n=1 Tax=Neolewinella aurantiaca TaxID=2602767 RepID=A0A5C7FIS9_9BACT|nr:hypothetical protein [Neolewinella aurantiaca]TXF91151.1 hypothetical protein FUA23_02675 [Neolewinella aurantiaca]
MKSFFKSTMAITMVLVGLVLPGTTFSQFVITNPGGTPGTVPRADDVVSCTDNDLRVSFRLTGSPGGTNPSFSVSLPAGVNYVDGSVTVVSSSLATAPVIGLNTGSASQPQFEVSGTFGAGDYVVISLARIANCEAIPGGGQQDAVTVTPGIGGTVSSNNYDVLAANLSVVSSAPVTTSVGSTETVTGTITNGGNGCVTEFEFTVMDAPGVMTTSIDIGGTSIMPTSTVGNLSVYTITSAVIGGDGCFDGGETLSFTRQVTIISCDLSGDGYTVRYGCFGEVCQSSSFANQQFNIAFTIPNVRYTSGVVSQPTDLCRDVIVEHTFTNRGTGAAFDIVYLAGFGASGLSLAGSTTGTRGMPVTDVSVNGVSVPFIVNGANGGLEADLSALTSDPDAGGLDDIDLDNQFDDLPAGASFTITVTHTVIPNTDCPANRSTGSYKVALDYTDQCDEDIARFVQNAEGSLTDFTEDSAGSLVGPADINDMETIEIEVCGTQRFGGSFVDCPTSELSLVGNLPPGFFLNFATVNDVVSPDVVFRNDSVFVTSDFVSAQEFCYKLNLTFDCSVHLAAPDRDLDFDFFFEFECDASAPCDGTRERFSCPVYVPNIHCGVCSIGGLTTQNTLAVRSTTGFANPLTCEEYADPASLTALQLKRAMPCDTVCIQANAIQLNGTSGPTWDNAYFHLEYDPLASNGSNTLSYAGGTVEIFELASGTVFECPIPVPQEVNINNAGSGNDQHILDFNLTDCLSVLPGSLLRPGDSVNVNLKVVVEKTGVLDNDVPTQLEDIRIFHYNLVDTTSPPDMVLDTVTCDEYALELYLHEAVNGGGGGLTNRQVEGCNFYTGFKTFPFSGSQDWYPGEIRPNRKLDSIVIAFTSRDVLDFNSVILRAEGNEDDGYGAATFISYPLGIPDRIAEGTAERRYIWINDGSWPLGDMNGRFNSQGGYSLLANYFPSCESIDGTLSMGFYAQQYGYSHDPDCYEPINNIGTVLVDHNLPSTTLQNLTGTVEASNDTVRWNVQIQNIVDVNGGFVFLGFEDEATPNIDIIGLRDIAADTIIPLVPYADGDWAVVNPAFPAEMALDYEVIAILTGCEPDGVRAITGFACDGPPDSPNDYPCDFDEVFLDVVPLLSRVQIRLNQAQGPYDLCTVIRDTVIITSAERAFIDNAILSIPLPRGLTESDALVEVFYPRLTGPAEVLPIVVSNDTLYVDLTEHTGIGEMGVPGTDDAITQDEREISVQLSWITDCDFRGGSTYTPVIFADRPCGDPAIGNGSRTTSDGININGALPSSVTAFTTEITPATIQGCKDVMISLETSITLGQTSDRDSLQIEFPQGLIYEPNSYNCTSSSPADQATCPTFVRVDVAADGAQTIIFSIAPNTDAPVTYMIDVDAMVVAGGICNDEGIVNLTATSSNDGIACPTDPNMVCDNFTIITGQATDTIRFQKPVVSLTEFMACTENGAYRVDGMITVDTLPINTGESVTFEFFCPDDPASPVGSFVVEGPIAQATPTAISTTIPASCAGQELIARITAIGDNCICETVETTFDILPEVIVEAGTDGTVCGTRVFDLAVRGGSITGGVTDGNWTTSGDGQFLDSMGMPATAFSDVAGYDPGPNDGRNGEVTLTLTSDQPGMCMPVTDDLILTVLNVDCGSFFWDGSDD